MIIIILCVNIFVILVVWYLLSRVEMLMIYSTTDIFSVMCMSMVLIAEGRTAKDPHADSYKYFCVADYGTANGSRHFHSVHFMCTLRTGSVDRNLSRLIRFFFFKQKTAYEI